MAEQEYFKKALSDFTFDVASGGAIRHLTDRGYTVRQIMKMLEFPTPYDRVQKTVWQHLLEQGQIMSEEPDRAGAREQYSYVIDYDAYGRSSFRRITVKTEDERKIQWRETGSEGKSAESFAQELIKKCADNGESSAYVSCDFGLRLFREPERFSEMLQLLEEEQRDYLLGLPWERRMFYHRLDARMQKIVIRLQENADYHGTCYFAKLGEKLHF